MARRRVHGPYRHGQRWRIVLVGEDGSQVVESFGSENEAKEEKRKNEQQVEEHEGLTVTQALEQYEVWMRQKGNKPKSIQTTCGRIKRLFGDDVDRPLPRFTEVRCAKLYVDLQAVVSVDYHRNALNEARTFINWCLSKPRRWLKRNPFSVVKGEGKRKKGKPQLRIDESRKFIETTKREADRGDIAGVVGLAALYFGTRITELVSRQVRDLDDDGWLYWIPDSKTESGKRFLEVPADLRPHLQQLAADKKPDAPLFVGPRGGRSMTRHGAYGMVKRMCRLAGVPEVSPHGLRGTHTSIARERGATPNIIAAAVGHSSYDGVTAKNYVAPGTDDRVRQRTVMGVLQGGRR